MDIRSDSILNPVYNRNVFIIYPYSRTTEWAHSLAWLERPADNREVGSSNLLGPTITPSGVDEKTPLFKENGVT